MILCLRKLDRGNLTCEDRMLVRDIDEYPIFFRLRYCRVREWIRFWSLAIRGIMCLHITFRYDVWVRWECFRRGLFEGWESYRLLELKCFLLLRFLYRLDRYRKCCLDSHWDTPFSFSFSYERNLIQSIASQIQHHLLRLAHLREWTLQRVKMLQNHLVIIPFFLSN